MPLDTVGPGAGAAAQPQRSFRDYLWRGLARRNQDLHRAQQAHMGLGMGRTQDSHSGCREGPTKPVPTHCVSPADH